jgi:hypothetical protein
MAYPYTHEKEVRVLSRGWGDPRTRTLDGWKALGGYGRWESLRDGAGGGHRSGEGVGLRGGEARVSPPG